MALIIHTEGCVKCKETDKFLYHTKMLGEFICLECFLKKIKLDLNP